VFGGYRRMKLFMTSCVCVDAELTGAASERSLQEKNKAGSLKAMEAESIEIADHAKDRRLETYMSGGVSSGNRLLMDGEWFDFSGEPQRDAKKEEIDQIVKGIKEGIEGMKSGAEALESAAATKESVGLSGAAQLAGAKKMLASIPKRRKRAEEFEKGAYSFVNDHGICVVPKSEMGKGDSIKKCPGSIIGLTGNGVVFPGKDTPEEGTKRENTNGDTIEDVSESDRNDTKEDVSESDIKEDGSESDKKRQKEDAKLRDQVVDSFSGKISCLLVFLLS